MMGFWDKINPVKAVKKAVDVVVDTVDDVGDAIGEAAGAVLGDTVGDAVGAVFDAPLDLAKGVWNATDDVVDFAAGVAETVSPVLGIAGSAVGMPWLGAVDEALSAVGDIMDGEMPDLGDLATGLTSFVPGLDGLSASSLLGAGLGELGLDDLADLGLDELGDAIGLDLGSATSLLPIDDILEEIGGDDLSSIWNAVESATDLDAGDLAQALDGALGGVVPDSLTDLVDKIDDGDIGKLFDVLDDEGGVGDFLKALGPEQVTEVIDKAVTGGKAGDLLEKLDDADVSSLLKGVGGEQLGKVVDSLAGSELSDLMGKLDGDAVSNVLGQAAATGKLDEVFQKVDPATIASSMTTMVSASTSSAGPGVAGTGSTFADALHTTAQDLPDVLGGLSTGSGRGGLFERVFDTARRVSEEPTVDPEVQRMRDFIDDLDLSPEQEAAYYEQFPEAAPSDADRIEDLEEKIEQLQDQLEDVLGEETVEGDDTPGSEDVTADIDGTDDLGLDLELDGDDGVEIETADVDSTEQESGGVDDVGDSVGDLADPEPDFEPEPIAEPEPEPVVDTYEQQVSAADNVESSVDDMFEG